MQALRALASTTAFRWTLGIAGGFTCMVLLLFAFVYWQTAVHERTRIDELLTHQLQWIAQDAAPRLEAWLDRDVHGLRYGGIFGPDGARLAGNVPSPPAALPTDGQLHQVELGHSGRDRDTDKPEVVRAVSYRLPDRRTLMLGYDIDGLEQVQTIIRRGLALGLVPAVLLSLAVGFVLARRGQRRIAEVHQAVARIRQGQLRARLPTRGTSDDLDKVAMSVNGMLDEIERLVDEIRGVGDSIAHDLRTPLTRVRTRLERSRDEARTPEEFQAATERAITAVDQALAVVSAVLRIGEIEHGRRRAAFAPVDLAEVIRDAAELYEPLAEERELTLRLSVAQVAAPVAGPVAARVAADRDLLLEAIGNLLDNAIKFAPPQSEVMLSLASGPGVAYLRITDRGPGIPVAERERVLQRFYRTEKSRTVAGSGLGLSLVAAVVALHGFHLRILDADPGCVIEIACPLAGSPETASAPVPALAQG